MTGFTAGSASPLNTLVASGDGGGEGQGLLLIMILLALAAIVIVISIINRVRQPYVVIVQNPVKLLMKTILLGVTTTVVAVAIVSILIATAGSPS